MYKSPPPTDSIYWSFGLMLDVCLKIGLGNPKMGYDSWTENQIIELLPLSEGSGSVRNWKTGGGISERNLAPLIKVLTADEPYQTEWELVIRNSARNIKSTGDIETQREKYFGVKKFTTKNTREVIGNYLHQSKGLSADEIDLVLSAKLPAPEPVNESDADSPIPENGTPIKSKTKWYNHKLFLFPLLLTAFALVYLWGRSGINFLDYGDIDFKKVVFTKIVFCSEENFDHDLNRCLKAESVFKEGIDKINISFESDVIKEDARFELHWYRYGEKFTQQNIIWTETFAHGLKYASTFHRPTGGYQHGLYQTRFFIKDNIVGETQFRVEKR